MPQIMQVLAAIAGLFLVVTHAAPTVAAPLSTEAALEDRVLGDPAAPVTILDYSSMTCPHCADFSNKTLPRIKKEFIDTGKAKLVFRDFPFDGAALKAAMLARCAPPERYYGLLDLLFQKQDQWAHAADPLLALGRLGKLAGLSQADIDACFANQALADGILKIRMDGEKKYGIESTPTFIFNDGKEKLAGALSFDEFAKTINKLAAR